MITRNPGNVTQLFAFDAVAGQRLYFDYLDGSNNPYWRLIDPKANVVFGPTFSGTDVAEPLLPIDGRYTLMIEGRVATSAPQTLRFRVAPLPDANVALTLGATTHGTLALPGDRMRYSFTLAEDALLLLDRLTHNGSLKWACTGPAGDPAGIQ